MKTLKIFLKMLLTSDYFFELVNQTNELSAIRQMELSPVGRTTPFTREDFNQEFERINNSTGFPKG
jgi:hypothetical protein